MSKQKKDQIIAKIHKTFAREGTPSNKEWDELVKEIRSLPDAERGEAYYICETYNPDNKEVQELEALKKSAGAKQQNSWVNRTTPQQSQQTSYPPQSQSLVPAPQQAYYQQSQYNPELYSGSAQSSSSSSGTGHVFEQHRYFVNGLEVSRPPQFQQQYMAVPVGPGQRVDAYLDPRTGQIYSASSFSAPANVAYVAGPPVVLQQYPGQHSTRIANQQQAKKEKSCSIM